MIDHNEPDPDGRYDAASAYLEVAVLALRRGGYQDDDVFRCQVKDAFLTGWAAREKRERDTS
jgi:hypothetical protein